MQNLSPLQMLENIYKVTRKATISADEHDACYIMFDALRKELTPKTSTQVEVKDK